MNKSWDAIDEQAAREGRAILSLSEYSPTRPNQPTYFGMPRRAFTTDLCHRIERLSSKEFKKRARKGSLLTM